MSVTKTRVWNISLMSYEFRVSFQNFILNKEHFYFSYGNKFIPDMMAYYQGKYVLKCDELNIKQNQQISLFNYLSPITKKVWTETIYMCQSSHL